VDQLLLLANQRKINFTLPDEAFGHNDEITVTGASVKPGMMYVCDVKSGMMYLVE